MKLNVNDLVLEPSRVGSRVEFQFTAPDDLEYVTLEKGDYFGDLKLEEIQLEQSTTSTSFVEPLESETVESGLFKSVRGIEYEITNPNSDTWAEIIKTSEASIQTYHNGTLQSTLAQTAEDVLFGVRDIVSGDRTSFNLRLDGIETSVKNEMYYSVRTQLADFIGFEISDLEGNYNTVVDTVNGHIQKIGDLEGNYSAVKQTVDSHVLEIRDIKGNYNTIQNTVDRTVQRIEDTEGNVNTIQNTADANAQSITDLEGNYNNIVDTVNYHSQTIGSDGGNLAQKVMSDELFKTSVTNRIEGTESSVTQLSDYINLRVNGSQITIGGDNITIDAKSIYLGSSTQIADGIITNKMIASNAQIDAAKISNLTVSDAQIVSLDVSKLSGNKADFVSAAFNGINSTTTIDSLGMSINSSNSWKMYLGSGGMRIRTNSGHQVGAFRAGINARGEPEGSYIMAERGYYAGIGHIRNDSSGLYYASLFDDSTGDVTYFDERDFRSGSLFDSIMKYNVALGSAGSYIRFGDIQIAWRTIDTDLTPNQTNGNIFRSNTGTSSFPAPFAETPVVVMSSAFAGRWIDITGNPTLTDVSYRLYSSLSSTATGGVYYIAIGRWK